MRLGQCHADALFSWSQRHSAIDMHRCHMVAQRFSLQLTTSIHGRPPESPNGYLGIDLRPLSSLPPLQAPLLHRPLRIVRTSVPHRFNMPGSIAHCPSTIATRMAASEHRPSWSIRPLRSASWNPMMAAITSDQSAGREERSTKGGVPGNCRTVSV